MHLIRRKSKGLIVDRYVSLAIVISEAKDLQRLPGCELVRNPLNLCKDALETPG